MENGTTQAVNKCETDEHIKFIEKAAYLRAEKRGFEPGHELEDWIAAEEECKKKYRYI